jgi:hypothetical protein
MSMNVDIELLRRFLYFKPDYHSFTPAIDC